MTVTYGPNTTLYAAIIPGKAVISGGCTFDGSNGTGSEVY
jgi:hypothetical protein